MGEAASYSWPPDGAALEAHLQAMHPGLSPVAGEPEAGRLHRYTHADDDGRGEPLHRHHADATWLATGGMARGPLLGSGMAMLPYLQTAELRHLEVALIAWGGDHSTLTKLQALGDTWVDRAGHLALLTAVREAILYAEGPT